MLEPSPTIAATEDVTAPAGTSSDDGLAGDDVWTGVVDADLFIFENDPNDGNSDTTTDFTWSDDAMLVGGFAGLDFATLDSFSDGILNGEDGLLTSIGDLVLNPPLSSWPTLQGIGQLIEDDLLFV